MKRILKLSSAVIVDSGVWAVTDGAVHIYHGLARFRHGVHCYFITHWVCYVSIVFPLQGYGILKAINVEHYLAVTVEPYSRQ